MPEPLLHLLLGMLIYLAALFVGRSPRLALAIVVAIQLLNEVNDYMVKGKTLAALFLPSLVDTVITISLPLLITVLLGRGILRLGKAANSPIPRENGLF